MLTARVVITAVMSIQLVSVDSGTVERCIGGSFHKQFPSPEPSGFATCFPYQNKSCCSPETTVELKNNGIKNLYGFDWDYCGNLSEKCRNFMIKSECFFLCDPNLIKWHTAESYVKGVPICSETCDRWFEACKDDKTAAESWLQEYFRHYDLKEPVKPNKPCRTFAEVYRNGEGLCRKIWGQEYKYEQSANCVAL